MDIMILASVAILAIVMIVVYRSLNNKQQNDSALRQRAVFNSTEHLTFVRLKEILPEANILAHVSFDALVTTKFQHTRNKYQKMFADFVILDKDCRVISIVALDDQTTMKRSHEAKYQDALLQSAGYRLVRYTQVPEYQQLREDFLLEFSEMSQQAPYQSNLMGKLEMYQEQVSRIRAYG